MDTREIQKLIDFISKSDLNEVSIETSELKLQIKSF
jgi:acetyl-CoA carboxylase biotin carboxyl carrier protein